MCCDFWVTICKTVHPMLSDYCSVCLSVLSVMLVYCGQTVGSVKMKLGMEVDLGPVDIVLDGNPAPHHDRSTAAHPFSSDVHCDQMAARLSYCCALV